jgi:hypothetical protein
MLISATVGSAGTYWRSPRRSTTDTTRSAPTADTDAKIEKAEPARCWVAAVILGRSVE